MDDFTIKHLTEYADAVCFDDERDAFIAWVAALDADDLSYYTDTAGWPAAREHFQQQRKAQR